MIQTFLNRITQLGSLSEAERTVITGILSERVLPKNKVLIEPGSVAEEICFIIKGAMRSYLLHDGEDITDYFFFEGAFASDYVSLFSRQPSLFYLETIEETQTVCYRKDALVELGQQFPIFETMGRIHAEIAFLEIEERMRMLQQNSLLEKYHHMLQKFPELLLRVPQHQVASYLGVKPESLSRIKKQHAGI